MHLYEEAGADAVQAALLFHRDAERFLVSVAQLHWLDATSGPVGAAPGMRPATLAEAIWREAAHITATLRVWRHATPAGQREWRLYSSRGLHSEAMEKSFHYRGAVVETGETAQLVSQAFAVILERAADAQGLAHYQAAMAAGLSAEGMLLQLATSLEAGERMERLLLVRAAIPHSQE